MKRKLIWILIAFGVWSLLQWYTLGGWIRDAEITKHLGQFMKIPCIQVDPIDPLRGTYLHLYPQPAQFEFEDSMAYQAGDVVWINYTCAEDNTCVFHSIQPIHHTPSSPNAIRCTIQYIYRSYKDSTGLPDKFIGTINYPFTRFYINEGIAPTLAEKYNTALRDTSTTVYAGVYVRNGSVSLDGIWLGDKKLE